MCPRCFAQKPRSCELQRISVNSFTVSEIFTISASKMRTIINIVRQSRFNHLFLFYDSHFFSYGFFYGFRARFFYFPRKRFNFNPFSFFFCKCNLHYFNHFPINFSNAFANSESDPDSYSANASANISSSFTVAYSDIPDFP